MAGHLGRILALDISASGSVISAGLDKSVRLWDRESGNAQRILLGATSDITAVRITADEEMVACTCLDGTIRVWDLGVDDADDDPDTLVGHDGAVTACAFCEGDSGETRFLTGDANGIVVVWGISHRQLDEPGNSTASRHVRSFERQHKVHAPIFEGPSPRILAVGWSKASGLLVGMTDRKFFVFWNLDGQVVDHLSFSDMVFNPQESDADWMAAEMRINPNHSVAVACNSVGSAAVFSLFRLGDSVLFA
jgi:WD40 repeat protein